MNKEIEYLEHKKKTIIDLVNNFNERNRIENQFPINEEDLNISKTFCSPEICKGCGECCSTFPCVYSSRNFLDITNLDYMRKILDTGVVTLVSYNNTWPLLIRNRGKYDSDNIACCDIDDRNPCILHTEKGCMLPEVYRASEGLLYVRKMGRHFALYDEHDYCCEYEFGTQIQRSLFKLYDEYKNVIIPKESVNEEKVEQFIKCLINKNN